MPENIILPISIATLASFIIESIWYSPLMFGAHWTSLVGINERHIEDACTRGIWMLYLAHICTSIVMFSVLYIVIALTGAQGSVDGAILGILCWFGFVATEAAHKLMWEHVPFKLIAIDIGLALFNLALGGAIMSAWK